MWISDHQLDSFHKQRATTNGRWVPLHDLIKGRIHEDALPSDIPKHRSSQGNIYLFLEGGHDSRADVLAALQFIMAARGDDGKKPKR